MGRGGHDLYSAAVPPVILAIALAGLAYWLQKSRPLAVAVFIGLLFIINQGLWKETVQTLGAGRLRHGALDG